MFLGADYFLRTSFSVTIESFLLRIRDVLWDGLRSELSNWTYRAKIPDHLAVRFTSSCEYQRNPTIACVKPLTVCKRQARAGYCRHSLLLRSCLREREGQFQTMPCFVVFSLINPVENWITTIFQKAKYHRRTFHFIPFIFFKLPEGKVSG